MLVDPSDQSRVVWAAGLGRISDIRPERLSLGDYPELKPGGLVQSLKAFGIWTTAGPTDGGRWRTARLAWSGRACYCGDGEECVDRGVGAEMEGPGYAKSAGTDHRLPPEQSEQPGRDEPHRS